VILIFPFGGLKCDPFVTCFEDYRQQKSPLRGLKLVDFTEQITNQFLEDLKLILALDDSYLIDK
jgi:hypothetical protein